MKTTIGMGQRYAGAVRPRPGATCDPAERARSAFDVAAGEGDSPYFCVFEGDFDDAAAMGAAFESPAGEAALADIPNYAPGGAVPLNYELRAA